MQITNGENKGPCKANNNFEYVSHDIGESPSKKCREVQKEIQKT